jgi:protein TonB
MPDKAHKTDGTQGAAANADAAAAEAALAAARIGPDLPSARAQGPSYAARASAGSDPLAILTAPGAEPEPDPDRKPDAQAKPEANASLFGILDADQRIRANAEQHERSLWAGAAGITLLYTAVIASQVMLGAPLTQAERERQERRGQDALPESISVELVPDPDKTAKTKKWRDGTTPAPAPSEQPPQPPQMAALQQPEVKDAKPTEDPAKDPTQEPREDGSPMMLDIESLVDAAAADLTRRIDRAFARKPQKQRREQQATLSGGEMKVRGSGASGKSSEFFRSVIAALMKTRPGPFALWGRVLVSFEISPSGTLNYVHLLHSSGNSALDAAAVNAIHKARFERPPPGLTRDERTYIIDYVFG